jgi:hypothetical protein
MIYLQDTTENVTQLDIYTQAKAVIYSVYVPQINADDVVQITSTFEATNPYTYNAMIGSWIILADSATNTLGTLIDPANSFNITPNAHHGVVVKARQWKAPSSYTGKYINVVAWSGSVNALSGHKLTIEQGYGHLDVVIYN